MQEKSQLLEMYQEMLSKTLRFYWNNLKGSIKARRYLKERGISVESVRRFGLGYSEAGSQSLRTIFPNYQVPALVACGLAVDGEKGRYDRFRDRIIFPILSESGRVIAFGGRRIEGKGPKYLNSPETPLFEKGATLFGLPQARASIEALQEVIVVEGYLDVVIPAQHGIGNIVATLGTATTTRHLEKLMSLDVRRIVFCFDGDEPGRAAAARAMEACIASITPASPAIGFVFLPSSHDPDSYVQAQGAEAFRQRIAEAIGFEQFLVEYLRSGKDLATCEGRAHMAHVAFDVLARIEDAGLYYRLCEAVAEDTELSVSEVIALSGSARQRAWHAEKTPTETPAAPEKNPQADSVRVA